MSVEVVEPSKSQDGEQALSVTALSKTFAGVRVLSDVSLSIAPGEVHALLGQNGSGKSTLIKCLAGVHRPDSGGSIRVAGRPLPQSYAPSDSSSFGLAFVHQDLGLIPDMTVAENLALGTGFPRRGPLIRRGAQRSRAAALLENFGLAVSPETRVRDLPVTARTLLAIVRAFQPQQADGSAELACLVLDEPTAALPDNDAGLLFEAIGQVTRAGVGVVYVTHRLEEVYRIADRATVLRDGHLVASLRVADTTREELVRIIVGQREARPRSQEHNAMRPDRDRQPVAFRAVGLTGQRIRNVSLQVGTGEIVGVAGLAGTGRSELARLIFGAQAPGGGSRYVGQSLVDAATPQKAIAAGIALVPEDRRGDGCVLTMSVSQNLTLLTLDRKFRGLLDLRAEKKRVADTIRRFDIRPADPDQHLMTLSGGNQQKVVLAKWLARKPKLLVLDEPVQGVDVGAKADIFLQLREAAAAGMAILVIDSDFDNLVELCDRVLVLRGVEIAEDVHGDRLTASHLAQATFGVPDQDLNLPAAPHALVAP